MSGRWKKKPKPTGRTVRGHSAIPKATAEVISTRTEERNGRVFTVNVYADGDCDGAGSFAPAPSTSHARALIV